MTGKPGQGRGPQSARPFWSAADEGQLRKLVAENLSAAKIGAAMGRHRDAIIGKVSRLGLSLNSHGTNQYTQAPRAKPARAAPAPRPEHTPFHRKAVTAPSLPQCEPTDLPPDQSRYAVSLIDISWDQCRYTVSERPHLFCGAPGFPWCDRHHRICHVAIRASGR